jgi:hypothetical protein
MPGGAAGGLEVDLSAGADVKNAWSYTSTAAHVFMVSCSTEIHRNLENAGSGNWLSVSRCLSA